MAGFWLFSVAFGSTLSVDAKLPTEVLVDGRKFAEVWEPARVVVDVPPGRHVVRIYRSGNPTDLELVFEPDKTVELVVGRTGITASAGAVPEAPTTPDDPKTVTVELRALEPTQVRIDRQRFVLGEGQEKTLDLPVGTYPVSFRNPAGTVIWARGELVVEPGARLLVQVASGRMPEVSGAGRFDP